MIPFSWHTSFNTSMSEANVATFLPDASDDLRHVFSLILGDYLRNVGLVKKACWVGGIKRHIRLFLCAYRFNPSWRRHLQCQAHARTHTHAYARTHICTCICINCTHLFWLTFRHQNGKRIREIEQVWTIFGSYMCSSCMMISVYSLIFCSHMCSYIFSFNMCQNF